MYQPISTANLAKKGLNGWYLKNQPLEFGISGLKSTKQFFRPFSSTTFKSNLNFLQTLTKTDASQWKSPTFAKICLLHCIVESTNERKIAYIQCCSRQIHTYSFDFILSFIRKNQPSLEVRTA